MANFLKICLNLTLIFVLTTAMSYSERIQRDACLTTTCCCGATCAVSPDNKETCACPSACTLQYDPVCGSDGTTYSNNCFLKIKACEQQDLTLVVKHKGVCDTASKRRLNPPCNKACVKIHAPVCGTDGKTYSNLCLMKLKSCETQTTIKLDHRGSCEKRCPNAFHAYCFAPCFQEDCAKQSQMCCCIPGQSCVDCTTPVEIFGVKSCPTIKLLCSSDSDCADDHECCQNGCAKTCMPKVG